MALDAELVAQWKRQYGHVYTVEHRGVDYAFREITLAEYEQAVEIEINLSAAEAEDSIVASALLSHTGKQIDRIPAGFISVLADEVVEVSSFAHPRTAKEVLVEERARASQLRGQMKAFVLATMPSYKEEDLDALTFRGLCRKVGLAEQIISINQAAFSDPANVITFDITDPEEEAAIAAAQEEDKRKRQERAWQLLNQSGRVADDDDKGPPIAPEVKAEDPIAAKLREALGG